MTIVATTGEITIPISIETLPPTPTKEDKILFNNLNDLLFELLIAVYREHLRIRHHTRR